MSEQENDMGSINRRIEQLERMLAEDSPQAPAISPETVEALNTLARITAESGVDIAWIQSEREREGESRHDALREAKHEVWQRTEEGRHALAVLGNLRDGEDHA